MSVSTPNKDNNKIRQAPEGSILAIAEQTLGDVARWREVLDNNTSLLPFALPPTLQADLDRVQKQLDDNNIGIKLPTVEGVDSEVKRIFGDFAQPNTYSNVLKSVEKDGKGVLDQLRQVDWLY
jgi:hypothetical protein